MLHFFSRKTAFQLFILLEFKYNKLGVVWVAHSVILLEC